ncbi:MAG: Na+/H+ antiporter [Chlamydiota bacterium]
METSLAIILSLFISVVIIGIIANKTKIPYPTALVFGGLFLSLIPLFFTQLPSIQLDPNLIFLTVLPPILFSGGYFTSVGGLKKNAILIGLLAVGLVIVTMLSIAGVAHLYNGMPWAAACALGAIIAPPDATASLAVTQPLRISHRISTILDGESLVNDATALVLFRLSLGALAIGSFSPFLATKQFVLVCVGGIAIGYVVGLLATYLIKRINNPSLCITISLICPYLSYLSADEINVSGVLAAVTAGLYMGFHIPKNVDSLIHIEAVTVWKTVIFLLNGAVFILIGLQLPSIMKDLVNIPLRELILFPILINASHVAVRFIWIFGTIWLPTKLSRTIQLRHPDLNWKYAVVLSWCGMRGVVSLAASMSIPLVLGGASVVDRSIIVYLTFSVIFFTLVVQGLTLPWLIRKLKLTNTEKELIEEAELKKKISETALQRLNLLIDAKEGVNPHLATRLQHKYEDTLLWADRVIKRSSNVSSDQFIKHSKEVQKDLLRVQRDEVLHLHEKGVISPQLLRKVLSSIDFESAHLSD